MSPGTTELKHSTNHQVSQTVSSGISVVQQMQRLSITSQTIWIWIQLKLIDLSAETFKQTFPE